MKTREAVVRPMLSVKYAPDVSPALAEMLEHHARRAGVSLETLEVIGASLDYVESFIVAAEDDRLPAFLQSAGLMPIDKVTLARWQARRLFGVEA